MSPAGDGLSERTRALIAEAAKRKVAEAPPLKDWQVAVLAPLFTPRQARSVRRRGAA